MLRGNNDGARWNWDTVLRHFRRIEGNNRLSNDLHGSEGPLLVSDPGHVDDVSRWFVQSVQEKGEPFTTDFNGPTQRGVGFYQFMNRKGKRSSAAYAYVEPLKDDKRLTVRLRAARHPDQHRERPRRQRHLSGRGRHRAARCIRAATSSLSSGALVTPKLLMLSGPRPRRPARGSTASTPSSTLPGVGPQPDRPSGGAGDLGAPTDPTAISGRASAGAC